MANNEIKVKITADNKPFMESLKQCTAELKKFSQAANSIKIDTAQLAKAETAVKNLSEAMKAVKGEQTISIGADVSQAISAIHEVERAAQSMQVAAVNVAVDKAQALSDIENIQQALDRISSGIASITVDNGQALRAAEETQKAIDGIQGEKVNVALKSTDALTALKQLSEALKGLKSATVTVKADGKGAEAEMQKVAEAVQNVRKYLREITVKINSRQALENITHLIAAARRLRQDLKAVKIPAGGNSELASQLQRIASLNRQVLSTMKEISAESRKVSTGPSGAGKSSESTAGKLGNLSSIASGAVQAFTMVKDLAASVVMPGFNFTKDMEMNQLGIAGILQSMTLLNGQAVSFGDAMNISSGVMQKLQRDAILTGATTEELVATFRALLAPGIDAGMNIDEIQAFTTAGVTAAKSVGVSSTQLVQELRDLVQGDIQASGSTLAANLGLTDSDIQEAKASSEGLFKFLMKQFEELGDIKAHFPDTLEGQMNKLKEVSTLASAEITKAFQDDFKDIAGGLADIIGGVNAETGKFTINPVFMEVIEDMKEVWQEFQSMLEDAIPKDGALYNDLAAIVKSLYHATIDVTVGFMDFIRVMGNSELVKGFTELIAGLANEIEWLAKQFRIFYDERARSLGVKNTGGKDASWADFKRAEDTNTKKPINSNDITSKSGAQSQAGAAEQAENERLKLAQNALKEMVAYWKLELDRTIRAIDDKLETNQAQYDQGYIGADQYYLTKVNLDIQKTQAELDRLYKELEATKNLPVSPKNESDQQGKLDKITGDIEKYTDQLAKQNRAAEDILRGIAKVSQPSAGPSAGIEPGDGEGKTWHKVTAEDPKYDALEDKAKRALELVADYTYQLTGQSLGLTSGKRSADLGYSAEEIGGHGAGMKFDAINDALYNEEIRRKVIDYAKSMGLKVLDEIKDPTAKATGQHLDFDASGFMEKPADNMAASAKQMLVDPGLMVDKDSAAWAAAHKDITRKALEIMQKFNAGLGDVTAIQLAQLEADYQKTIDDMENNGMFKVADMARSNLGMEKRRITFAQAQKNIDYANEDLMDTQEELYYEMESGAKDSTQIAEEYLARCQALFSGKLIELQAQLDEAMAKGDKDLMRDIKKKIRDVITTISDGFKAILDKIDSEANREIEKIQMNKSMTRMQKDDAIDAVRQKANEKKIITLQNNIKDWKSARPNIVQDKEASDDFKRSHEGLSVDQAILKAEKELEYLHYQLEQTPTLLGKVQIAGKQAFEDGLLDFFTRGIMECESLGNAFRNLAVTVLEAINKMYAEALVKNIMGALFPVAGANIPGSGQPRPNGTLGPLRPDGSFAKGGPVRGPGTGRSDSILAALSNGEFVINARAVRQVGIDALHRINNGHALRLPLPKFADGGMISDKGELKSISGFAAYELGERMDSFGANISNSFSPEITVRNTFNGDGFMKSIEPWMISRIDERYKRNMVEYAKLQHMLSKKFR